MNYANKSDRLNDADENASILNLNDDCLEYICKKLSPIDQLNFALTCQRFYDILVMISKVQYALFKTQILDNWTPVNVKMFLQIVGSQIKTLEAGWNQDTPTDTIHSLASFCRNVEKLKLLNADPTHLIKTLTKNMKLRDLKLHHVKLNYDLVRYFETTSFACAIANMIEADMYSYSGLEELSIIDCPVYSSCHVAKMVQSLKNLHYLDIRCFQVLKTEHYKLISEHLVQLRTLKITSERGNFHSLARLPNIVCLDLSVFQNPDTVTEEFLTNLATHRARQLEELYLITIDKDLRLAHLIGEFQNLKVLFYKSNTRQDNTMAIFSYLTKLEDATIMVKHSITDDEVLNTLSRCHKLNNIAIKCYFSLTPTFPGNAFALLQKQYAKFYRRHRLHLYVGSLKCICQNLPENDLPDGIVIKCISCFDDY